MFDFEYHLKNLPDSSGVYLMKNSLGEVIYVGKAKILKNRVRQYFQSSKNHSEKVRTMVSHIAEFEYIVTDSEMEALILECNLIKKYSPKYNVLLKDDKHYPFIKLTINEQFPRVFISRNFVDDNAKYFGPYTDGRAVYEVMDLIKRIFPLRTCRKAIKEEEPATKVCLNYHIGKCSGPCQKFISKEDYGKMINEIIELLKGKNKRIGEELKEKMIKASEELEFEQAADYRDKLNAIEVIHEKQKMILSGFNNEDYINLYKDETDTCIQIFFVRNGKVSGREDFTFENTADIDDETILSDFVKRFYGGTAFIPKVIYMPCMEDVELIEKWLSLKNDHKVSIKIPSIGEKKKILDMVKNNAKITLEQFKIKLKTEKEIINIGLQQIADIIGLEELPNRIEAYDISNLMGMDSVGTMVVFQDGKSKNSDYRRFKIRTVKGADDYGSMKEVLYRRFSHGLEEIRKIQEREIEFGNGKFSTFPDLVMMDGGKGQINAALEVLKSLNIKIPVCGMVKDNKHRTRGLIYGNEEIIMDKTSHGMRLITRIQDEVHRFSITYHRTLRDKKTLLSILEEIPNIGAKRRVELLKKFGSVENIKKASLEELCETPTISKKAAESIIEYFKGQ